MRLDHQESLERSLMFGVVLTRVLPWVLAYHGSNLTRIGEESAGKWLSVFFSGTPPMISPLVRKCAAYFVQMEREQDQPRTATLQDFVKRSHRWPLFSKCPCQDRNFLKAPHRKNANNTHTVLGQVKDGAFSTCLHCILWELVYWRFTGRCFFGPFSWECRNPNWRTYIFQRGRLKPPTSYCWVFHYVFQLTNFWDLPTRFFGRPCDFRCQWIWWWISRPMASWCSQKWDIHRYTIMMIMMYLVGSSGIFILGLFFGCPWLILDEAHDWPAGGFVATSVAGTQILMVDHQFPHFSWHLGVYTSFRPHMIPYVSDLSHRLQTRFHGV